MSFISYFSGGNSGLKRLRNLKKPREKSGKPRYNFYQSGLKACTFAKRMNEQHIAESLRNHL